MIDKKAEQKAAEKEYEKWVRDVVAHITNPESTISFGSLDKVALKDEATVIGLLDVLDNIEYGGFGDEAIAVQRKKGKLPIQEIMDTGVVTLEVGMGQRLRKVTNPAYSAVWGSRVSYIPWPDGHPRFEQGRKGNRIVTLSFMDLSRVKTDEIIK
jgi:hypothetical protein